MAEKRKSARDSRKKQELLGVLIMALAVLLLLGVVSYRASDFPAGGESGQVRNWLGLAGALISHYLYVYTIGYASIIFPLIVFLLGWNLFAVTPLRSFFRICGILAGFGLLLSTALALPQAVSETGSSIGYRLSGLFGGFIAETLSRWLGTAGSVIVLLTAFIALFMTATSWSFRDTVLRIRESVQALAEEWRLRRGEEEEEPGDELSDEKTALPARSRRPPVPEPLPAQPAFQKPEIRTADDHRTAAAVQKPRTPEPAPRVEQGEYCFPPVDLLRLPPAEERKIDKPGLEAKAQFLE
ncbi:DNA translocase FtsK 4TM domain-containing protein, partial [bacterium]|nr:DNA translocase FtsK 4TM domain-containing protein [bacterium]